MNRASFLFVALACALPLTAQAFDDNTPPGSIVNGYPSYTVATILVTFPDAPEKEWTKAEVESLLFTASDSMAAFYADASRGAMSIVGDVFDNDGAWYEIARPVEVNGACDWSAYFTDALAAADANIDFASYTTVLVIAPSLTCSTGGYASYSVVPGTEGRIYRVASVDGYLGHVPHHEFGHVIGMGHANSWQCDGADVRTGENCTENEYDDRFDVMGVSPRMLQPSAPHKENLGWLLPSEILDVTVDGDYVITNYESTDTAPKVLKVPYEHDANGVATKWYYLEYRQAIGFDNIPRTPTIQELGLTSGALVHIASGERGYIATRLLDMTPGSFEGGRDIFDPALHLGSSYSDTEAGVSFGVLARTKTTMTIRVRFSAASLCEWRTPGVAVTNVRPKNKAGKNQRFLLTVTNRATLCGSRRIELRTARKPSGWSVAFDGKSTMSFTLTPSKSVQVAVRMTAPWNAKAKRYLAIIETTLRGERAQKALTTIRPLVSR